MDSVDDEDGVQEEQLTLEIECVSDDEVEIADDQPIPVPVKEELILPFDDDFDKFEKKVEILDEDFIPRSGIKLEPSEYEDTAVNYENDPTADLNVESSATAVRPNNSEVIVIKQEKDLFIKQERVDEEDNSAQRLRRDSQLGGILIKREGNLHRFSSEIGGVSLDELFVPTVTIGAPDNNDGDDDDDDNEDVIEVDEDRTIQIKVENARNRNNKTKPYYVGTLKLLNNSRLNNFKVFCCSYCSHIATSVTNVMRHCSTHVTARVRVYQCHRCEFKSTNYMSCHNHMKIHTGYSCDQCRVVCRSGLELTRHKRQHVGEKRFICSICYFKAPSIARLKYHITYNHPSAKPFFCHFCNFKTYDRGSFKKHLLVHNGQLPHSRSREPYQCSFCTFKCSTQGYMTRHMEIHTAKLITVPSFS